MTATASPPIVVSPAAWKTLAVSSLAVLAAFLDTTVLFVAFPDIVASFDDVAPAQLSWVLNAYTIVFAALLVPAGKIADRVGHKRAFLVGSAVFTVGSMLCGVAPSAELLIAFRLVQAVGAATLLPSSLALILRAFPPQKVPVAVAIWGATGAVAGALGPTLGAALVEVGGWRWVFFINLPIGIATLVIGRRLLAESKDPSTALPAWSGVVLIIMSAGFVSLGVVQSEEWGWADGRTIGSIIAGVVLLGVFVRHQRVTSRPAVDLELFSIPNFSWGNAASMAFGVAFTAMFFSSILFLTEVWGYSILRAGFAVAPGPALVAVLAPRFGALAGKVGQRPLLLIGGALFAVGGLWRLVFLSVEPAYVIDYLPSMFFTGVGVALCLPQLSSVVAQALPPNRLGVGGGVNQAIRQFGGTLGVALTIAFVGRPTSLAEANDHFGLVWWLLVAGGVATSLLAAPLGRIGPSAAPSGPAPVVAATD
ncbi:MAG: DHA2 family efflux MFS transporter permease subunit [Ilumatobacter sp.]|uniref:DHA2 family efflux MFS transporter permease subunit n=1 Tax=Ilumatobacter sp. TaxID=1967498 RepID=UPI00391B5487